MLIVGMDPILIQTLKIWFSLFDCQQYHIETWYVNLFLVYTIVPINIHKKKTSNSFYIFLNNPYKIRIYFFHLFVVVRKNAD
jgi:hypothetical protein